MNDGFRDICTKYIYIYIYEEEAMIVHIIYMIYSESINAFIQKVY